MTETHGLKTRCNVFGKIEVYLDEPAHFLHGTIFAGNLSDEAAAAEIISTIGPLIASKPVPAVPVLRATAAARARGQLL